VRVVQGPNFWRLVRSDHDAANVAEVLDLLGPAMAFFLSPIQPEGSGVLQGALETERGNTDDLSTWEWRIGQARPIKVLRVAHDDKEPLPAGTRLGSRADPAVLPSVDADLPWFVDVMFFWRGKPRELDYPALSGTILGTRSREPSDDLDWYLDTAVQPADPPPDPGDESWFQHHEKNAEKVAKAVGIGTIEVGVGIAGVAAVLWFLTRK